MVLKAEVDNHIAPVLTDIGELYSPVKSESLLCSSSKSDKVAEKNQRIFVYEDGNWSLKGRYDKAIKINDTLAWSNDRGNYALVIAFVELFTIIHAELH